MDQCLQAPLGGSLVGENLRNKASLFMLFPPSTPPMMRLTTREGSSISFFVELVTTQNNTHDRVVDNCVMSGNYGRSYIPMSPYHSFLNTLGQLLIPRGGVLKLG